MIEMPINLARKLNLFEKEYPEKVNRFYLKNIRRALDNGMDKAFFYKIKDSNIIAGVPREHFLQTLEEILGKLINLENYELAAECQELINRVMIENIIRESQGQ